jgi:hypothetical protein
MATGSARTDGSWFSLRFLGLLFHAFIAGVQDSEGSVREASFGFAGQDGWISRFRRPDRHDALGSVQLLAVDRLSVHSSLSNNIQYTQSSDLHKMLPCASSCPSLLVRAHASGLITYLCQGEPHKVDL